MEHWGIHWFRRDLRVAGNPALLWNWKEHQGRVVGLFCLDSKFLAREDFSPNRFAFFMETLHSLREELKSIGSDLWVIDCQPDVAFPKILESLKKSGRAFSTLSMNRDYEPFARERDSKVIGLMEKTYGIPVHHERDHLLIEPLEISKPGSSAGATFYQVYTPYSRRWFDQLKTDEIQQRLAVQKKGLQYLKARRNGTRSPDLFSLKWEQLWKDGTPPFVDALDSFIEKNRAFVTIPIPTAGSLASLDRLDGFKKHLESYGEARDYPAIDGTSKLSIFLKNGSITSSQVIAELDLQDTPIQPEGSRTRYLKELVWREFYYSILFHKPSVETQEFLERYRNLNWDNQQAHFEAWKEGKTGYPIVDAGMRQLKQEGWMHNRVRMIVASFLTKDLLIDWRWGERHFMKELLDGDLAPNNGGWQWAASVGCDPQPYFRIFNPELQSQRFDPQGIYIKKYVPELVSLSAKQIHAPHKFQGDLFRKISYVTPIVDHASQKPRALALYRG